jgi:hypothetical protein
MATPEKQPELSFFCLIFMSLRSKPLEGHRQAECFSAPETCSSSRKPGSLPNYFAAALQTG